MTDTLLRAAAEEAVRLKNEIDEFKDLDKRAEEAWKVVCDLSLDKRIAERSEDAEEIARVGALDRAATREWCALHNARRAAFTKVLGRLGISAEQVKRAL